MGKKEIKGPQKNSGDYKMTPETNEKTLNGMRDRLDDEGKKRFDQAIDSGINNRVKLIGSESEFNMVSGSHGLASGNYVTPDNPGETPHQRQENLQLPSYNDALYVDRVKSTRPQLGVISTVKPQPEFAKEAGYEAVPGLKQVFTPNNNPKGAIADGRYIVLGDPRKEDGPNNPPPPGAGAIPPPPPPPPGGRGPTDPNNMPPGGDTSNNNQKSGGSIENNNLPSGGNVSASTDSKPYDTVPASSIKGVDSSGDHF